MLLEKIGLPETTIKVLSQTREFSFHELWDDIVDRARVTVYGIIAKFLKNDVCGFEVAGLDTQMKRS